MKVLIFDTETTGFLPGNICQLSYIIMDETDNVVAKNFFFKVDRVEYGALQIHGFSVEKLDELSGGKRFIEHVNEISGDFETCEIWTAHNLDFDMRFIKSEFARCRKNTLQFTGFCTMKYFKPICKLNGKYSDYKYPRLEQMANFLGIDRSDVLMHSQALFKTSGTDFHDARFDTVVTYLCFKKALEAGHVSIGAILNAG